MRRAVIVVVLVGCGEPSEKPDGGDGPAPDAAEPACAMALPAIAPIAAGEPLYNPDAQCAAAPRGPYPTEGCRLDLRAHGAGDVGTCAAELAAGTVSRLLGEPIRVTSAALPLVVDLPEGVTDEACTTLCRIGPNETVTRFGLRILVEDVRTFLSIRVEPPWLFVTGNETEPTLCHNGMPTVLELGAPVACAFTYADEIDLVTDDPSPPPARLLIMADETSNEWSNCCLFPTP